MGADCRNKYIQMLTYQMIHEWKSYVYVTDLRDINGLHGREMETEYLGSHESHHKPLKERKDISQVIQYRAKANEPLVSVGGWEMLRL